MFKYHFVLSGVDREGCEVRVSDQVFSSRYEAELAVLDFYGNPMFKRVWVSAIRDAQRAA